MSMYGKAVDSKGTRVPVVVLCQDKSLTKQAEAEMCDINFIMRKYDKSGLVSHLNDRPGFYADVSSVPDYQASLAIVRQAQQVFAELPGKMRARFNNDPAEYLAFVENPANREEMIELGMIPKPEPVPEPAKV